MSGTPLIKGGSAGFPPVDSAKTPGSLGTRAKHREDHVPNKMERCRDLFRSRRVAGVASKININIF